MPLKWIDSQHEKQCTAQAKSSRQRCLNPAAYGCRTCHMHGARQQHSIKRGKMHPKYRHGMETIEAKNQRKASMTRLKELSIIMRQFGLT